jgi:transcriptional regulator with XRE-family HTH domain
MAARGDFLRRIRTLRGLTIRELARKSGVSAGLISRIEADDAVNLTERTLVDLASALEIDPADLAIWRHRVGGRLASRRPSKDLHGGSEGGTGIPGWPEQAEAAAASQTLEHGNRQLEVLEAELSQYPSVMMNRGGSDIVQTRAHLRSLLAHYVPIADQYTLDERLQRVCLQLDTLVLWSYFEAGEMNVNDWFREINDFEKRSNLTAEHDRKAIGYRIIGELYRKMYGQSNGLNNIYRKKAIEYLDRSTQYADDLGLYWLLGFNYSEKAKLYLISKNERDFDSYIRKAIRTANNQILSGKNSEDNWSQYMGPIVQGNVREVYLRGSEFGRFDFSEISEIISEARSFENGITDHLDRVQFEWILADARFRGNTDDAQVGLVQWWNAILAASNDGLWHQVDAGLSRINEVIKYSLLPSYCEYFCERCGDMSYLKLDRDDIANVTYKCCRHISASMPVISIRLIGR